MKTKDIKRLLTRAGFCFPYIETKVSYEISGVKEGTELSVIMEHDGDMHVTTVRRSVGHAYLRFRNDMDGGRSPVTWNALRCLAFALSLKRNPVQIELYDPKDPFEDVFKFLSARHDFESNLITFPKSISRLHDDHDGTMEGHIHLMTDPESIYISANRMSDDKKSGLHVRIDEPKPDESPMVWNAFMLLVCAIKMDNASKGRVNIWND